MIQNVSGFLKTDIYPTALDIFSHADCSALKTTETEIDEIFPVDP